MELKELLAEITYEVDAKISNPDFGGFPHEQFLEWCGEQLSEFGEIEAGSLTPSTYEQRGRAIHGLVILITMAGWTYSSPIINAQLMNIPLQE